MLCNKDVRNEGTKSSNQLKRYRKNEVFIMFDSKKLVKVVSVAVASMSLLAHLLKLLASTLQSLVFQKLLLLTLQSRKATRSLLLLRILRTKKLAF